MTEAPIFNRKGQRIHSVDEWAVLAKPAAATHWKDGRSAKELAKAWIDGSGSAALTELLSEALPGANFTITRAKAEAQTAFDDLPGGRRNHDLLIEGRAGGARVVVGLEAKADETFGQTLAQCRRAAEKKIQAGAPTNADERLRRLVRDLAGTTLEASPALCQLRYQLFTGVAGTLAAAGGGDQAVFVVHDFRTSQTTESKRAANSRALASFVKEVFREDVPAPDSWVIGPVHVPAQKWAGVTLWIGHLSTDGTAAGKE